jgi:hypothetical protein
VPRTALLAPGRRVSASRLLPAAIPPVAVLAVDPGGLAPFGPVKWLLLPAAVLAAIASVGPGRRLDRRLAAAWAAFLAVVGLAAVFGLDDLHAWIGTPERRFGALTWVVCVLAFVVGHRLDDDGRRTVLCSTALTAAVLGAWGAGEQLGWQPIDLVGVGDRPVGTLGSSAYLGAAAVLLAPVAAFAPLAHRSWRLLAFGLAVAALVVSGARAAWFGGLVVLLLAVVARRTTLRRAAVVLVLAVGLVVACGLGDRAGDTLSDNEGGAGGRVDEWQVAARVIARHPGLGTGPEGYRIAFGRVVDEGYEARHGRDPLPDRAHSAVLDVAATTGLLGLAAYLVLLGLVIVRLLVAVRRGPALLAGAALAVLGYWAQSLLLFPLAELEPLAWLLAGLVVGATATTRRTPLVVPVRVLAGVAAVAVAVAGTLDVVADHRARTALDAVLASPEQARAATHLRPDSVRYRLAAARALERRGSSLALDQALEQLDRALEVSPRDPVVRLERARLLVARARRSGEPGHRADAQHALRALLADDPRNSAARELWNQIRGSGV